MVFYQKHFGLDLRKIINLVGDIILKLESKKKLNIIWIKMENQDGLILTKLLKVLVSISTNGLERCQNQKVDRLLLNISIWDRITLLISS